MMLSLLLSTIRSYEISSATSESSDGDSDVDYARNLVSSNFNITVYLSTDNTGAKSKLAEVITLTKSIEANKKTTVSNTFFKPKLDQKYQYACGFEKAKGATVETGISQVYVLLTVKNTLTNVENDNVFNPAPGRIFSLMAKLATGTDSANFLNDKHKEIIVSKKDLKILYAFTKENFEKITNLYIAQVGGFQKLDYVVDSGVVKVTPVSDVMITSVQKEASKATDIGLINQKLVKGTTYDFHSEQRSVNDLLNILNQNRKQSTKRVFGKEALNSIRCVYSDLKINGQLNEMPYFAEFNQVRDDYNGKLPALEIYFANITYSLFNLISKGDNFGGYFDNGYRRPVSPNKVYCPTSFDGFLARNVYTNGYMQNENGAGIVASIARTYGYSIKENVSIEELDSRYSVVGTVEACDNKVTTTQAAAKSTATTADESFYETYKTPVIVVSVVVVGSVACATAYSFL